MSLTTIITDVSRLLLSPSKGWSSLLACCICAVLLTVSSARPVLAEKISTEEWNISADRVIQFENPTSIVAKGNVVLEKRVKRPVAPPKEQTDVTSWSELLEEDPQEPEEVLAEDVEQAVAPEFSTTVSIYADWIVYDVELESIKAKGNLRIITDEDELYAKEGTLNLTNETGKFEKATIVRDEDSLHLEGESIEKTGFDTYRIVDGWAITCKVEEGQTPPWSFASSDVQIRQGGYAILKHARFRIHDIPVLYSPWLAIPLNDTRQTGLLFPEFTTSSNSGFGFNLPFFINISESMDLTLFPEYFTKRGFMPGAEFRLVASEANKTTFTASYLSDQIDLDQNYYDDTGYTHDNTDRYWVRGKADFVIGNNWQTRTDIDIVSDEDYLREFNAGTTGFDSTQARYLETFGRNFQNDTSALRQNTFKMLRNWSGISLEGQLLGINDASTISSDIDTPLWKLPSIDFNGTLPTGFGQVNIDWDTDYVNYWRDDGVGANRFDIRPTLSAPLPLGSYLEARADVGVRDTLYFIQTYGTAEWDKDTTQNRFYPEVDIDVATTLQRDFFAQSESIRTIRHQLRPYVTYGYVPDVDQDDIPYFDSVDLINDINIITYGFDNFFNRVSQGNNGLDSLSDYATLQIEQAYDFNNNSDEPFSDILAKLKWEPFQRSLLEYKTYYDVYGNGFTSHNFEGTISNSKGDYIGLEYSYKDTENIEQINGVIAATLFDRWLIRGLVEHSLSSEETINANGSITYMAPCWSVSFETKYNTADTTYFLMFNLANIGLPLGINF